jgi:hypothetical protein
LRSGDARRDLALLVALLVGADLGLALGVALGRRAERTHDAPPIGWAPERLAPRLILIRADSAR